MATRTLFQSSNLICRSAKNSIRCNSTAVKSFPASSLLPKDIVVERVIESARKIKSTPLNVSQSSHLVYDLNFDSLLRKQFVDNVSAEFCVKIEPAVATSIVTVDDAVLYISTHPKAR